MKALGGLGALWLLVAAGSSFAVAADAPASAPAVTVEGRRLSVRLVKVPLAQALDVILERAAVELTLFDGVEGEVTAEFDDVPFEEGLRRLLGPRNYVVVYTPEGSTPPDGRLKIVDGKERGPEGTPARPALPRAPLPPDSNLAADVEAGGRGRTATERARFLERVLATEPDAGVRSLALKSLINLNPSSLASILQAARFDPSVDVRRYALELLVVRAPLSPLVLDTFRAIANGDPDAAVREQAAVFTKHLDPSQP